MTRESSKNAITAQQVEGYLEQHPDFFLQREHLLAKLELNHPRGAAISLAERQIKILREQKSSITRQVEELVENAKRHDQMMQKIHQFLLELVQLERVEQVVNWIESACVEQFGADSVRVALVGESDEDSGEGSSILDTLGIEDTAICVAGEQVSELNALLALTDAMRSFAVLPLCNLRTFGYVILGSRDGERYRPDLGTLYLQMLADCCSSVLSTLLGKTENGYTGAAAADGLSGPSAG